MEEDPSSLLTTSHASKERDRGKPTLKVDCELPYSKPNNLDFLTVTPSPQSLNDDGWNNNVLSSSEG